MLRALAVATLCVCGSYVTLAQSVGVLRIKVVLVDAAGTRTPVPRHVLLISDNPATAAPREIVTGLDGTAEVRLRPGNYTVESDSPVMFQGKSYEWTKTLDIVAGRDAVLELTADNADVGAAVATDSVPTENDPAFLLPRWQDSVAALWTETRRASGFVVDARGLVVANQRLAGTATSVEVQLSPAVKVAARVLVSDAARDVSVLWVDPAVASSLTPIPLACGEASTPVVDGQKLFAIGVPLRREKEMSSAVATRIDPHAIAADFIVGAASTGGPVFAAAGGVVGITSIADDADEKRRTVTRVVPVADVCAAVASAEPKMKEGAPPSAARLPVEPSQTIPIEELKSAAQRRTGALNPYPMSSSDFDIVFITPVINYGGHESQQASGGQPRTFSRAAAAGGVRPLIDFANWWEYAAEFPPVLMIRATPKLVEGFWTTVARGAARTQGMALPPIKHFKSGFSRMRVLCGDTEVTPIHPFKIEQRISETEAINEGLYIVDPGALGPHCTPARLVLYSEKEPQKADAVSVDPRVLQQIWRDFEPYRER
jgi:S1-C subfamily serine protease